MGASRSLVGAPPFAFLGVDALLPLDLLGTPLELDATFVYALPAREAAPVASPPAPFLAGLVLAFAPPCLELAFSGMLQEGLLLTRRHHSLAERPARAGDRLFRPESSRRRRGSLHQERSFKFEQTRNVHEAFVLNASPVLYLHSGSAFAEGIDSMSFFQTCGVFQTRFK